MGKILKHEFIKYKTSIIVLAATMLVLQLIFVVGYFIEEDRATALGLLCSIGFGFVMIVCAFAAGSDSYTRNLKEKSGYMLFLTPNSGYKIVSAKLIFSALLGFITLVLVGCLMYADARLVLRQDLLDTANVFITSSGLPAINDTGSYLFYIVLIAFNAVIFVTMFTAIGFSADTMSHTLLHNKKGNKILSAVFFVALVILFIYLDVKIPSIQSTEQGYLGAVLNTIPSLIESSVVCALNVVFTGWMLEKKINL